VVAESVARTIPSYTFPATATVTIRDCRGSRSGLGSAHPQGRRAHPPVVAPPVTTPCCHFAVASDHLDGEDPDDLPSDLPKHVSPGGELNSYRLITRQVLCR
jgi:hypothetical protein